MGCLGVLGVVVGDREAVAYAGTHDRIKQTRRDRARQLAGESGCNVVGENSERSAGQWFGHAVCLVALGLVPHQLEGLRSRLIVLAEEMVLDVNVSCVLGGRMVVGKVNSRLVIHVYLYWRHDELSWHCLDHV